LSSVVSTVLAHRSDLYAEAVNPQWGRHLDLLEMNVRYEPCVGAELFTAYGRRITDFLLGDSLGNYCSKAPGNSAKARIWQLGCRIPHLFFLVPGARSFDDWLTIRKSSLGRIG